LIHYLQPNNKFNMFPINSKELRKKIILTYDCQKLNDIYSLECQMNKFK